MEPESSVQEPGNISRDALDHINVVIKQHTSALAQLYKEHGGVIPATPDNETRKKTLVMFDSFKSAFVEEFQQELNQ